MPFKMGKISKAVWKNSNVTDLPSARELLYMRKQSNIMKSCSAIYLGLTLNSCFNFFFLVFTFATKIGSLLNVKVSKETNQNL